MYAMSILLKDHRIISTSKCYQLVLFILYVKNSIMDDFDSSMYTLGVIICY